MSWLKTTTEPQEEFDMTQVTAPRPRTRSIDVTPTLSNVETDRLATLVNEYAVLNYESNKYKREMDAKKKEVHSALIRAEQTSFTAKATLPDGSSPYFTAEIASPTEEVVDVSILRKLVSEELFMQIISATKTAVKEKAGTNVLLSATVEQTGNPTLSIRKAK